MSNQRNTGNLKQVLSAMAKQLNLKSSELLQYALDAPYAFARPDGNTWMSGTGSENEKRILYALAKALNTSPQVDLGTRWGAFAGQLMSGNPAAKNITVDIEPTVMGTKQKVGRFVPDGKKYKQHIGDCVAWLKSQNDNSIGFIVEDTAHNYDMTYAIYTLAKQKLIPGGVIVSHDVCRPKMGDAILSGILAADIKPQVYLVDGDSCGFAVWRKGDNEPVELTNVETIVSHEWEIPSEAISIGGAKTVPSIVAPKPKRKRRKTKRSTIEDV